MASITLDWIQLAAALGALHGVLLAIVLLAQRSNRTANHLLAALVAAFTIYLASSVYYAAGLVRLYPHFFGISYQMPWIFGPLVYLYARAASDQAWRFRWRNLLHFVPVAISVLVTSPYYLMSGAEKVAMYDRVVAGRMPPVYSLLDPFKYVSGIAYSIATVLFLRAHRRRVKLSYSNLRHVNLRWLLRLTLAAAVVWAMETTLRVAGVKTWLRDEHITLAIAVVVYGIGYMSLRQPEIFRFEMIDPDEAPVEREAASSEPIVSNESTSPRYERSGLGGREAEELERSLLRVMEQEKPWKDSELTLAGLAAQLRTTPHKLSEVLNAQIGQTFYDFVNGYRVREVQRRIQAGDARTLKILALAMDAGFASKSTFNEVFKKHTSQTPSDFRQAVGA